MDKKELIENIKNMTDKELKDELQREAGAVIPEILKMYRDEAVRRFLSN